MPWFDETQELQWIVVNISLYPHETRPRSLGFMENTFMAFHGPGRQFATVCYTGHHLQSLQHPREAAAEAVGHLTLGALVQTCKS